MKNTTQGYIRVHMGLFENHIRFGDSEEILPIGESLLQFIYTDLSSFYNRTIYNKEDFQIIHPYFEYCDPTWMASCIQQMNAKASGSKIHQADETDDFLDLTTISNLQVRYRKFLSDLYTNANGYDDQRAKTVLASSEWSRTLKCFSQASLSSLEGKEAPIFVMDYFLSSFEECLFLELLELLKRRIFLKTCKNCERLFIAKRANVDYCSRIYTADGKACSEVGYSQTFARNMKNDELLTAYTRAYKTHYARMTKPRKKMANMTRDEFDTWYREAKMKLDQARAGLIDAEEYKEWLKL